MLGPQLPIIMVDHYLAVLELAPGATEPEIKAAYRRLAKKYHPDTSREPDAEAKFIEVTEAYEFLTHPEPPPLDALVREYEAYSRAYETQQEQARASARQRAAEAARDRIRLLQKFYRIITPLVLVAGLFNGLLLVDYLIPPQQHEEAILDVYPIYQSTGRGQKSWNYDAIEFEHFTLRVKQGEATGKQLPDRGTVVTTSLLSTMQYADLIIDGREQRMKPAYGLYRVFGGLIPAIFLGCFFYFRWSPRGENKMSVGIMVLFALVFQLVLL